MVEDADINQPLDDKELPQEDDVDDEEGEPELASCPSCGKTIYEETVKCPHCGEWILDSPKAELQRSRWFWPIIIAIGVAMILVALVARAM